MRLLIAFLAFTALTLALCLPAAAQDFWEPGTHEFERDVDVVHVTHTGTVLAAPFADGIYRLGLDSMWTQTTESTVWQIIESADVIYAATSDGLLRSTDDGISWDAIMLGSAYSVFASGATIAAGGRGGQLYLSHDDGLSWEVPSWIMMPLGLDDLVGAVFALGDQVIYDHIFEGAVISENGGSSWFINSDWRPDFFWMGSDGLTYSTRDDDIVTTSDGINWNVFSRNPLFSIDQFRRRGDLVSVSSLFGAAYSTDGGESWFTPGGLPVEESIGSMAIRTDGHLYAGTSCCVRRSTMALDESAGTAVKGPRPSIKTELVRAYPNPVDAVARVPFTLSETTAVRIEVYDVRGRRVETLLDRTIAAGAHEILWRAQTHAPGTYLIRMVAGGHLESRPVIVAR